MPDDPRILRSAERDPRGPYGHEWFALAMHRMATGAAFLFGGPVYLVGSALWSRDPGDYDVRVVLQEHDAERPFGPAERAEGAEWWHPTIRELRLQREGLKQSRRWWVSAGRRARVDFQFQTLEVFCRNDGPKLRIDHAPRWAFLAGLTGA